MPEDAPGRLKRARTGASRDDERRAGLSAKMARTTGGNGPIAAVRFLFRTRTTVYWHLRLGPVHSGTRPKMTLAPQ